MARHTNGGAFYSTDDLIRMARLGNFGQFSNVAGRAFVRLRQLEVENQELRQRVTELENVQTVADSEYPINTDAEVSEDTGSTGGSLYDVEY